VGASGTGDGSGCAGSGVAVSDMVSSLANDPDGAIILFVVVMLAFTAVCMVLRGK
jgi:hypothetical protein